MRAVTRRDGQLLDANGFIRDCLSRVREFFTLAVRKDFAEKPIEEIFDPKLLAVRKDYLTVLAHGGPSHDQILLNKPLTKVFVTRHWPSARTAERSGQQIQELAGVGGGGGAEVSDLLFLLRRQGIFGRGAGFILPGLRFRSGFCRSGRLSRAILLR